MAVAIGGLIDDLLAESRVLDLLLDGLPEPSWDTPTPAPGWAVRDQVSHLAYFDDATTRAITDLESFAAERDVAVVDIDAFTARRRGTAPCDVGCRVGRMAPPGARHHGHRAGRARPGGARPVVRPRHERRVGDHRPDHGDVGARPGHRRRARRGPPAHPCAPARRPPRRAHHAQQLTTRTGWPVPTDPVRVELVGPGGDRWAWGDEHASNSIVGPALDFCLVVTQRRHVTDSSLVARGPVAAEWLSIAQAFAGPPGAGRAPGQFSSASRLSTP